MGREIWICSVLRASFVSDARVRTVCSAGPTMHVARGAAPAA